MFTISGETYNENLHLIRISDFRCLTTVDKVLQVKCFSITKNIAISLDCSPPLQVVLDVLQKKMRSTIEQKASQIKTKLSTLC